MSTISDYYNATAVLVGSFVGYQSSGSKGVENRMTVNS